MICYFCSSPACAKIGTAKANIFNAMIGGQAWDKFEIYVCRKHHEEEMNKK